VEDVMKSIEVYWDCDGVLIDSERPAFRACNALMKRFFAGKGVNHRYGPASLQSRFAGKQVRKIVQELAEEYNVVLTAVEIDQVEIDEDAAVIEFLSREAQMTPGVDEVLAALRRSETPMAVVSSSSLARVNASLTKADLIKYFHPGALFSAKEPPVLKSKPEPDVYLHAVAALSSLVSYRDRRRMVVVEDSPTGVEAARRACIPVIGYIGAHPEHILAVASSRARLANSLTEKGAFTVIDDWEDFFPALEHLPG
jgi:HAD superfamily hydrolase (TIGR01509 family)